MTMTISNLCKKKAQCLIVHSDTFDGNAYPFPPAGDDDQVGQTNLNLITIIIVVLIIMIMIITMAIHIQFLLQVMIPTVIGLSKYH